MALAAVLALLAAGETKAQQDPTSRVEEEIARGVAEPCADGRAVALVGRVADEPQAAVVLELSDRCERGLRAAAMYQDRGVGVALSAAFSAVAVARSSSA